jgi:hypothetical protein
LSWQSVPEPSSAGLLLLGFLALCTWAFCFRRLRLAAAATNWRQGPS